MSNRVSATINVDVDLMEIHCATCGTIFMIDERIYNSRREDGNTFWCPNGHGNVYGTTLKDQLAKVTKELNNAKQDVSFWKQAAEADAGRLDDAKRQLKSMRSELTGTKKRVGNGACPCCKRQFVDLQRHMENKHPEYQKE